MSTRKRSLMMLVAICAAIALVAPSVAGATPGKPPCFKTVTADEVIQIPADEEIPLTTKLCGLVLADGVSITAPDGYSLTLTVNGVETGGKLVTTAGTETKITGPASYQGNIVLTVAEANPVEYSQGGGGGPPPDDGGPPPDGEALQQPQPPPPTIFPFRQALYLDARGLVEAKSVLAAVLGKKAAAFEYEIENILIRSTGENFDGIFVDSDMPDDDVADGNYKYTVRNVKIELVGNGRSDFIGYGAAIVARGDKTTLVVDGARIVNEGVVRSGVVADTGSNVIVKNSFIQTDNGVMPADYMPTIDTVQMRSVPWMLSLSGNVRATNLLGTNTKASYINSYVGSEGWGVLSTDGCTTPQLTAINSTIAITGEDGYGSYGIGNATERFLGCTIDVPTYATISRGSFLIYGDSDPETVAQLNSDLGLGLTAKELASLKPRATIVNSDRFGIMWHGGGTLDVSGGTVFNTGETTFLDKGQAIAITVDGSEGAQLNPGNGVIMQVMDDDDPGPQPPFMYNTGIYDEPTDPVIPQPGHDLTTADDTDAQATFSNIKLEGDFYNSMRGDIGGMMGPPTPRNLGLTFDNAQIVGTVSASTATHLLTHIEYPIGWDDTLGAPFVNVGHTEDYKYLGEVTNTPSEAVNNGVIVSLINGSEWTVTGTCYLTKLDIAADAAVVAPPGHTVSMTVGGVDTEIVPGSSYTGPIVLTIE